MASFIDISGLDKADVLMRLYNGGFNDVNHAPVTGILQRMLPPMLLPEAQALIAERSGAPILYFDYVNGKALKIDLTGDRLDPRLYDRDCGEGAASRALGLPMTTDTEEG
jgi:hypothetical protein